MAENCWTHFKTEGMQKNYLKGAKRTAPCDNTSFDLLHTFFGDPTLTRSLPIHGTWKST